MMATIVAVTATMVTVGQIAKPRSPATWIAVRMVPAGEHLLQTTAVANAIVVIPELPVVPRILVSWIAMRLTALPPVPLPRIIARVSATTVGVGQIAVMRSHVNMSALVMDR